MAPGPLSYSWLLLACSGVSKVDCISRFIREIICNGFEAKTAPLAGAGAAAPGGA